MFPPNFNKPPAKKKKPPAKNSGVQPPVPPQLRNNPALAPLVAKEQTLEADLGKASNPADKKRLSAAEQAVEARRLAVQRRLLKSKNANTPAKQQPLQ